MEVCQKCHCKMILKYLYIALYFGYSLLLIAFLSVSYNDLKRSSIFMILIAVMNVKNVVIFLTFRYHTQKFQNTYSHIAPTQWISSYSYVIYSLMYNQINLSVSYFWSIDKWLLVSKMTWLLASLTCYFYTLHENRVWPCETSYMHTWITHNTKSKFPWVHHISVCIAFT